MTGLEAELHDNYGSDCKVKLTTVYPFTVNTGLAHEPTTRFPSIFPITEPGKDTLIALLPPNGGDQVL